MNEHFRLFRELGEPLGGLGEPVLFPARLGAAGLVN
jgi:hypothetical protein